MYLSSVLLLLVSITQALVNIQLRQQFRALDVGPSSSTGALKNFADVQFYGEVSLGFPGQTIPVLFDTGSYETWFPTTSYCQSRANECKSAGFRPSRSITFQKSPNSFRVKYLSSSVTGVYGQDYIRFGQLSTSSTISFGLVDDQIGLPERQAFDGSVGMGPRSSFVQSALDKAVADGKGARRMFSFYLSGSPDGGSLTLGGFDETHIAGPVNTSLSWFPASPTTNAWALSYWILPSLSMSFNGVTVSSNTAVIFDSGSSFILGPQRAVAEIYRLAGNVDSSGHIKCWRVPSLPVLSVMIGKKRYDLRPEQYAYRGNDKYPCHIGIMPLPDNSMWILGDSFMRNFLSVFSLEDPATAADAVRNATLSTDEGPRQVRHWVGLAPVFPLSDVKFPAPTWLQKSMFYRILEAMGFVA